MHDLEKDLQAAARAGKAVIIDGATGTELEKRGVPMDGQLWNALASATHPDVLSAVHADYLEAGARIIITNTFATARFMLGYGGQAHRFESLNRQAARVALAVRNRQAPAARVAGALSGDTLFNEAPALHAARRDFRDQAALLADEGVDLIVLEMMQHPDLTAAALEGAAATQLPVWLGYSVAVDEQGTVTSLGQRNTAFRALLEALDVTAPQAVGLMHSRVEDIRPALSILKAYWDGPSFAYAHSGEFKMPHWEFSNIIAPEDYVALARTWIAEGVSAIGGCCGLGPNHIRLLAQELGL